MVAGENAYLTTRFPAVYSNPLANQHVSTYLNDYSSMAYAAAFDSSNNLYVGDLNWDRVLIYLNPLSSSPPTFTLTVTTSGTGSGTVTSSSPGIDCGAMCQYDFTSPAVVTLTATPLAGSAFSGWSGQSCSGTGACQVTMDRACSVTPTFTKLGGAKFHPVTPCRLVDTRHGPKDVLQPGGSSPSVFPRGSYADGEIRSYDLTSSTDCTVLPAGAAAWSLLFQFTTSASPAYLQAWPYISESGIGAQSPPTSESTMLGYTDRWTANSAIIPGGNDANGSINVLVQHAGDVIVEVDGYFK